jgi:uncharacterized alpha-E superfamily protein
VLLRALAELSTEGPAVGNPGEVLRSFLGDTARPGTLAHDVRALRELASAVRDQLSGDTWSVLARLDRTLAPFGRTGGPAAIPGALPVVLETLLAFAGLAAESMVRDQGWHLLDAGRRVERALQVARLLDACFIARTPIAVEDLVVESVLVAAESIITHRRRYGAGAGIESVLSLLLFDRDNPRGVAYQLDQLSTDLRRVGGRARPSDAVSDQLEPVLAILEQASASELALVVRGERTALDGVLKSLIDELHRVAEAIAATHFPPGGQLQHFPGLDPVGSLEPL